MPSRVISQMPESREPLAAFLESAHIRLLSSVDPHVCIEVAFLCKRSSAWRIRADKWPLTSLKIDQSIITWVLSWIRSLPILEYLFPHTSHKLGLSPVCVKWWLLRCPLVTKALPHPSKPHIKGLSPVYTKVRFYHVCTWVRMCVLRLPDSENFFPHPSYGQ